MNRVTGWILALSGFLTLVFTMIAASMFWELQAQGVSVIIVAVGAALTTALIWPATRLLRRNGYDRAGSYVEVE
jgi:hypothetical protein